MSHCVKIVYFVITCRVWRWAVATRLALVRLVIAIKVDLAALRWFRWRCRDRRWLWHIALLRRLTAPASASTDCNSLVENASRPSLKRAGKQEIPLQLLVGEVARRLGCKQKLSISLQNLVG